MGNSEHNQIYFDINVKSESKNKKTYKRNFHNGNYKDMRKYLAKLDWNNMLMNKTAIECWNILKYEIESIIDKFVPFQKQGKRCRKKPLSKEAIRKIVLKQTNEPFVSRESFDCLDGFHVSGRVLVPQLTRQLRDLGIGTVAQQRL